MAIELVNELDILYAIREDKGGRIIKVEKAFKIDIELVFIVDDFGEGGVVFEE